MSFLFHDAFSLFKDFFPLFSFSICKKNSSRLWHTYFPNLISNNVKVCPTSEPFPSIYDPVSETAAQQSMWIQKSEPPFENWLRYFFMGGRSRYKRGFNGIRSGVVCCSMHECCCSLYEDCYRMHVGWCRHLEGCWSLYECCTCAKHVPCGLSHRLHGLLNPLCGLMQPLRTQCSWHVE